MRRFRWSIATFTALAILMPLQASPVAASHHSHGDHGHNGHQGHRGHQAPPDRIELPDGWQPEGITTDGRFLYAGSLAGGAIWRASTRTGEGEVLADGAPQRAAAGLDYDFRRGLLWVAGGPTGQIRAQDADTGEVLATYAAAPKPNGRFLNDVVVTRRAVYVTDSLNQELVVVPLKGEKHGHHRHHSHGVPPGTAVTTLPLTGDLVYEDGFNLNGIVKSKGWLIAVQTNTGQLFRIDPRSGDTALVDLGGASLVNGDGLEIDGDTLYVVLNMDNQIVAVDLNRRVSSGEIVATIEDDGFDVPTTVALAKGSLWAVNARFGTAGPTPETAEYWITRVDAL